MFGKQGGGGGDNLGFVRFRDGREPCDGLFQSIGEHAVDVVLGGGAEGGEREDGEDMCSAGKRHMRSLAELRGRARI